MGTADAGRIVRFEGKGTVIQVVQVAQVVKGVKGVKVAA